MSARPEVAAAAGLIVGVLFGVFGVGGSSFATPHSAVLGVPGPVTVAAPLPATIPAALAGMATYARRRQVHWPIARWSIIGGVPATIVGALCSRYVGGRGLLIASGIVLALVGIRILIPLPDSNSPSTDGAGLGSSSPPPPSVPASRNNCRPKP